MCLRDDPCFRASLQEVSAHMHVSSEGRVSWPDLSLESGFARPCVFATTCVFAQPVFGKWLRPPTCLRDDACLRQTCLRQVLTRLHSGKFLGRGSMLRKCPRTPTCLRCKKCLRRMCLQTPTCPRCLRGPFFTTLVLDPMCLQTVSAVFGRWYVHPPGNRDVYIQHTSTYTSACVYIYIYIYANVTSMNRGVGSYMTSCSGGGHELTRAAALSEPAFLAGLQLLSRGRYGNPTKLRETGVKTPTTWLH